MKKYLYKIIINDGYCSYEYPIELNGKNSINDIAKKIFKAFRQDKPAGTLIRNNALITELKELIEKYEK